LCRLQSLLRMRSITWPVHRGSPKTTSNNFWPRIVYSLYNFYGATMSIKGTFILEHPHVKAIFGRKKVVKIGPKMAIFRKFKGLNIKYSYRDPKRHFLTPNDVFWRILRKNLFKGVGCSLIEEPKKTKKKLSPQMYGKITYLGSRNPWADRYKILRVGFRPGHNHACQFWWRSVKGFWCGEGSNFGLFYWLASSRVCEVYTCWCIPGAAGRWCVARVASTLTDYQLVAILSCRELRRPCYHPHCHQLKQMLSQGRGISASLLS